MNALETLRKHFGAMIPEAGQLDLLPDYLSTGIAPLDYALSGGIPRGHISVVYGPEGAGKSGLMGNLAIQAIKHPVINGEVLYLATEPKVNPRMLFNIMGIPQDKIHVVKSRPGDGGALTGNKAMDIIREAVGQFDLIVLDSIGSLAPQIAHLALADKAMFALVARLLSAQLPLITATLGATKTALAMVNQERASMAMHGKTFKMFGGYAIRYHPAVIMRMRKAGQIKDNGGGFMAKVTVEKNSFGPERRDAEWDIYYETGVDYIGCTFKEGRRLGVISVSAKVGDVSLCHDGEHKFADAIARLREEPELYDWLYNKVMEAKDESE